MTDDESNDSDDKEWSYDDIVEALSDMNDYVTSDIESVMLSGDIGFHIFADTSSDNPLCGWQAKMAVAFFEVMNEFWMDREMLEQEYGELSPEDVLRETKLQIDHHIGSGRHFRDEFLSRLADELDADPEGILYA